MPSFVPMFFLVTFLYVEFSIISVSGLDIKLIPEGKLTNTGGLLASDK